MLTDFQIVFFMQSQRGFALLCVCFYSGGCAAAVQPALKKIGHRELLHNIKQLFASFPVAVNVSARGKFKLKGK